MDNIKFRVTKEEMGIRLDQYLASKLEHVSRSQIQKLIQKGEVTVSGYKDQVKPSYRLQEHQLIFLTIPDEPILSPKKIPLDILYEDQSIVVLNKPTGMIVHPGAGNNETTLVEGLLASRDLPIDDDPARPGVVHRLDKDTSGVMVMAKTYHAMNDLKRQFAHRKVCKLYVANVEGKIGEQEGLIDAPIGRDLLNPRRMSIIPRGRKAQTEFRVLARTNDSTLLLVHLLTGRTHQIRLHMRYIGHCVIGDKLYGHANTRLMLHAWYLAFIHPESNQPVSFTSALPSEFCLPQAVSLQEIAGKFHCPCTMCIAPSK
jgi:23S rRNA pseudouridine1911/1915/1917 synthase